MDKNMDYMKEMESSMRRSQIGRQNSLRESKKEQNLVDKIMSRQKKDNSRQKKDDNSRQQKQYGLLDSNDLKDSKDIRKDIMELDSSNSEIMNHYMKKKPSYFEESDITYNE